MTDETIENSRKKLFKNFLKQKQEFAGDFLQRDTRDNENVFKQLPKRATFFFFFSFFSLSSDALTQQCNVCRVHRHALRGPWETAGTGRWLLRHRRRIEMLRSAGSNFVVDFSSNFEFISNKHILKFAGASNFFF